jgi:hypothetical protein
MVGMLSSYYAGYYDGQNAAETARRNDEIIANIFRRRQTVPNNLVQINENDFNCLIADLENETNRANQATEAANRNAQIGNKNGEIANERAQTITQLQKDIDLLHQLVGKYEDCVKEKDEIIACLKVQLENESKHLNLTATKRDVAENFIYSLGSLTEEMFLAADNAKIPTEEYQELKTMIMEFFGAYYQNPAEDPTSNKTLSQRLAYLRNKLRE